MSKFAMGKFCLGKLCPLLIAFAATRCATQQVTIETDVPATVSYVSWGDLGGEGDPVGKTPLTLDFVQATGRVIRIDAKGKMPFLWTHSSSTSGQAVTASFKLPEIPKPTGGDAALIQLNGDPAGSAAAAADLNKTQRVIYRSYRALNDKDYELAQSLAAQAKELAPFLAMPHIVSGVAAMETGKKDEARQSFIKAKALAPEDSDVDELLKMVSP
jgi:hypothetical protein